MLRFTKHASHKTELCRGRRSVSCWGVSLRSSSTTDRLILATSDVYTVTTIRLYVPVIFTWKNEMDVQRYPPGPYLSSALALV